MAERLMGLAGGARMPQVRALATEALVRRTNSPAGGWRGAAHEELLAQDVRRFLVRPAAPLDYLRSLEPFCSLPGGS